MLLLTFSSLSVSTHDKTRIATIPLQQRAITPFTSGAIGDKFSVRLPSSKWPLLVQNLHS